MNPCDGKLCWISGDGDRFFLVEERPFLYQLCKIIKITRSGLIQVHLFEDEKLRYSFPKRNVYILEYANDYIDPRVEENIQKKLAQAAKDIHNEQLCTINGVGDTWADMKTLPFKGAVCRVLGYAGRGCVRVALANNRSKTLIVHDYNIDFLENI